MEIVSASIRHTMRMLPAMRARVLASVQRWRIVVGSVSLYERHADYDMKKDLVTITWHHRGEPVPDRKANKLEAQYQRSMGTLSGAQR